MISREQSRQKGKRRFNALPGFGLTLGFTPNFGVGADVRYHRVIYKNGPDTEYLLPMGKLVFIF